MQAAPRRLPTPARPAGRSQVSETVARWRGDTNSALNVRHIGFADDGRSVDLRDHRAACPSTIVETRRTSWIRGTSRSSVAGPVQSQLDRTSQPRLCRLGCRHCRPRDRLGPGRAAASRPRALAGRLLDPAVQTAARVISATAKPTPACRRCLGGTQPGNTFRPGRRRWRGRRVSMPVPPSVGLSQLEERSASRGPRLPRPNGMHSNRLCGRFATASDRGCGARLFAAGTWAIRSDPAVGSGGRDGQLVLRQWHATDPVTTGVFGQTLVETERKAATLPNSVTR